MANNINNNNNQVPYFNPQVSVEEFQKIIQSSDSMEKEIKKAAYAALAKNKPEALAAGLNETLAGKIKSFEKSRNKEITDFLRGLNTFGDNKTDFLDSNDDYSAYKKAIEKAKEISRELYLPNLDKQEIEKIGPQALKQLNKIESKTEYLCCAVRDPLEEELVLDDAFDKLLLVINNDANHNELCTKEEEETELSKAMMNVKDAIKHCIFWGYSFDKLNDHMKTRTPYERVILKEQFEIAEYEVKNYRVQQKAKREQSKAQLLEQLAIVQSTYNKFKNEPAYLQFSTDKQALMDKVQELSTFCLSKEISTHSKISQESKDRFERMIKKA